ncbi:MAG: hypothetical protein WCH99_16285 [Verrucomicrobiota bacterium]
MPKQTNSALKSWFWHWLIQIKLGYGAVQLLALMGLLALAGCARTPETQRSVAGDRYQVAEASLRYLMDAHSGHGIERDYYSAYVIERGEFATQLLSAFAGYKPRVVADMQVSTDSGKAMDKATGKPVKLWSVKIVEMRGDDATTAVSWYSGNLAAGSHTLHLRWKDARWTVVSVKKNWIS